MCVCVCVCVVVVVGGGGRTSPALLRWPGHLKSAGGYCSAGPTLLLGFICCVDHLPRRESRSRLRPACLHSGDCLSMFVWWPTRTGDTGELVLREVRGSCPFPPAAAATSASSPEEKVVVQGGTAPGVKTLHLPASACAPPHPPSDPPCPPCPSLPRTAAASTRAPTTRGGGWIIFWCLPRWRHACMTATTCHRCRWGAGKRLPVQRAAQQGPLPAGVRAGREAGGRPGAVTSPLTNPALPSYRPLAILILQVLGSDHCPLGLVLKLDG